MPFLMGQPEIAGQGYGRAFRKEILSRTVQRVWHCVLRNASGRIVANPDIYIRFG
jgi:hypothetical protein